MNPNQIIDIIWIITASGIIGYTFLYGKLTYGKLAFCCLSLSFCLIAWGFASHIISPYGFDMSVQTYTIEIPVTFQVDNIHKFIC